MIYYNTKTAQGVETVDSLDKKDFISVAEYSSERRRLLREYKMVYSDVYISSRATKEYRNK